MFQFLLYKILKRISSNCTL